MKVNYCFLLVSFKVIERFRLQDKDKHLNLSDNFDIIKNEKIQLLLSSSVRASLADSKYVSRKSILTDPKN